jgi:hypothetical protein
MRRALYKRELIPFVFFLYLIPQSAEAPSVMLASPKPHLETLDLREVCEMGKGKSSNAASMKATKK